MNWYYTKDGNQLGPVSDYRLREMAAEKEIMPETLIWERGMTAWARADEIRPDLFEVKIEADLVPEAAVPPPLPARRESTAKHLLMRLLAKGFDLFLVYLVMVFMLTPELEQLQVPQDWSTMNQRIQEDEAFRDQMVAFQAKFAMHFLAGHFVLQVLALSFFNATPGKLLLGLRVVQSNGQRLTLKETLIRSISDLLNYLLCGGFSYLWVLFDRQQQGLHDRLARTRVVAKSELPKL